MTKHTLIHERVELARNGQNPKVICRVRSGWIVLGDVQPVRGYSLLLADPVVESLNALTAEARATFLEDMAFLGDALLACTDAYRINYGILGNSESALHAHVFPRYENEPEERRRLPVWFYDWKNATPFDAARDAELMRCIAAYLERHRRTV